MKIFAKLFGTDGTDFKKLLQNDAQIIDVRTEAEFDTGHIPGSQNIPLQNLVNQGSTLDPSKPVITCCASGVRSASAKNILKQKGFAQVYDGGSWKSLQKKIKK